MLTKGKVEQLKVDVKTRYGGEYKNVIIVKGMLVHLVLEVIVVITENRKLLGLLRGGTSQRSAVTLWNEVEVYCELHNKREIEKVLELDDGNAKDEL